jgi:hypothetical protein
MKILHYRSNPVLVEVVRFDGRESSANEIELWSKGKAYAEYDYSSPSHFMGYLVVIDDDTLSQDDYLVKFPTGNCHAYETEEFDTCFEVVEEEDV